MSLGEDLAALRDDITNALSEAQDDANGTGDSRDEREALRATIFARNAVPALESRALALRARVPPNDRLLVQEAASTLALIYQVAGLQFEGVNGRERDRWYHRALGPYVESADAVPTDRTSAEVAEILGALGHSVSAENAIEAARGVIASGGETDGASGGSGLLWVFGLVLVSLVVYFALLR